MAKLIGGTTVEGLLTVDSNIETDEGDVILDSTDNTIELGVLPTGSGNGLDADLLDGKHATSYVQLSQNEVISGDWSFHNGISGRFGDSGLSLSRVEGNVEYFENAEDKSKNNGWNTVTDENAQSGSAAKADVSTNTGHNVLYGPYNSLPNGRFRIEVRAKVSDNTVTDDVLYFDINSNNNTFSERSPWYSGDYFEEPGRYEVLRFETSFNHADDWEYRIGCNFDQTADVTVDWLRIIPVENTKTVWADQTDPANGKTLYDYSSGHIPSSVIQSAGLDSDTLDGEHASAFANSGHTHDGRYYTETEADSNFAAAGHLHDGRYIQDTGEVTTTLDAQNGILVTRGSTGLTANNSIEGAGTDEYIGIDTTSGATGGVLLGYYNAPEVRVGSGNLTDFNWNGNTVATRPWAKGSNILHSELSDAPASAHHSRYANEEAQDAVGTILNTDFNYDDTNNVISLAATSVTVAGNSVALGGSTGIALGDLSNVTASGEGAGNGLDSDLLDGEHASAFADSGHAHAHSELTSVGSSDHHTKYTNSEAVSAVNSESTLSVNVSGNADTVDGYDIQKNGTDGAGIINFKT